MEESGQTSEQSHSVRNPRKFVESRRSKFQAIVTQLKQTRIMKEYREISVVVTYWRQN